MGDPKRLFGFAAIGFGLSFLFGLFSGVGFLHILLRALIFAVIFAGISILISILDEKFLSVPQDLGMSDSDTSRPASAVGGNVNITIDDDALPEDDQGPKFTVSENRPSLGVQELRKAPVSPSPESQPITQSVNVATTVQKVAEEPSAPSAVESVSEPVSEIPKQESEPEKAAPSFQPVNLAEDKIVSPLRNEAAQSEISELSELPDIGNITGDSPKPGGTSEVISDSEFASEGEPVAPAKSFADGSSISTQNASVMAQAIRTILAKEN